jgi:GR25 family glycosyltransferase involved in LPS biosynthesis
MIMRFLGIFVLSMSVTRDVNALVVRATESSGVHSMKQHRLPLKAYVITDNHSRAEAARWTSSLGHVFGSVKLMSPVYLQEAGIQGLLANGTIDPHYSSARVPQLDPANVMANPKFPHELGCTLAHRNVWQQIVDHHSDTSAPWAAIFEGDAIMRYDFAERVAALQAELLHTTADLIYMGHCFEYCPAASAGIWDIGGNVHVVRSNRPLCTHAYFVSYRGAQRLLNLTVPMKKAVDERMAISLQSGKIDSLTVCPPIARQPWQREQKLLNLMISSKEEYMERGGNPSEFENYMAHLPSLRI